MCVCVCVCVLSVACAAGRVVHVGRPVCKRQLPVLLGTMSMSRRIRRQEPTMRSVYDELGSRVVSVLDSGAEGTGFKSQSRRCRVTVLGKLFTRIVTLFTKQQNWYCCRENRLRKKNLAPPCGQTGSGRGHVTISTESGDEVLDCVKI